MPQERGWRPQGSDAEEIWDFVAGRVADVLEVPQEVEAGRPEAPEVNSSVPGREEPEGEALRSPATGLPESAHPDSWPRARRSDR